jgi:hypothetical protein
LLNTNIYQQARRYHGRGDGGFDPNFPHHFTGVLSEPRPSVRTAEKQLPGDGQHESGNVACLNIDESLVTGNLAVP